MSPEILKKIQNIKADGEYIFYAQNPSPMIYKLCIRNVSHAETLGMGKCIGDTFYPSEPIWILDVKKDSLEKVSVPIKFVHPKPL